MNEGLGSGTNLEEIAEKEYLPDFSRRQSHQVHQSNHPQQSMALLEPYLHNKGSRPNSNKRAVDSHLEDERGSEERFKGGKQAASAHMPGTLRHAREPPNAADQNPVTNQHQSLKTLTEATNS